MKPASSFKLIISLQEGEKKLEKQTSEEIQIWPEILVVGLCQTVSCVTRVSPCCSFYFLSRVDFWDEFAMKRQILS